MIPTHERTNLLAETVRSVLRQTRAPREIIVVDNGTQGRAASALASFGSAVTLIKEKPLGKQVARNTGIRAASCTWIATLDDDDLYHPTFLATAAKAMEDGRPDIISSDHRKFREKTFDERTNFELAPAGYWEGIATPPPGQDWSFVGRFPRNRLLRRIPFYPSTMLVRRDLALSVGGYDPRMRGIMAEDVEYLVRILAVGNVAILWKPLVDYRLHPGNDTASINGQTIGRWKIFEFVRENHSTLDTLFRTALDRDLVERRTQAFNVAFLMGDVDTMKAAWKKLAPEAKTAKRRAMITAASLPRPLGGLVGRAAYATHIITRQAKIARSSSPTAAFQQA